MACDLPSAKYVTTSGDCDDDNADVHPQLSAREKMFFDIPYKTPAGAISFDYDCSGKEEGNPNVPTAGSCQLLMLNNTCSGSGYKPTTRTTQGANPYCGSQSYQTCKGAPLCTAAVSNMTTYTCR
jgi:hypothetical protein